MNPLGGLIAIIAIVYSISFSRKVRSGVPEGTVNEESLSGIEKLSVWLLAIVNPVLHGAILYFSWRKKLPTKAKQANRISFIVFGIEIIVAVMFIVYLNAAYKINTTAECHILEEHRNSKVYNDEDAACLIVQKTDATFDEAQYVVALIKRQEEELPDGSYIDPYEYVTEHDTLNLGKEKITKMVDAEYYYLAFIGVIEE